MTRSRLQTTPVQPPSPDKDTFISLSRALMTSPAFSALKPLEARLYLALIVRHDGYNNGKIVLGVRDAAKELSVSKTTILPAFNRLVELGLIVRKVKGEIYLDTNGKVSADSERKASEWEITDYNTWEGDKQIEAKRTYLDWSPEAQAIVAGSRPKNLPKPRMNGTKITPAPIAKPKPELARKTRQAPSTVPLEQTVDDLDLEIGSFDEPKPRPDPVPRAAPPHVFEVVEYDSLARNKLYAADPEDIPF